MPELILPGVYIDVRAEALIVGSPISVGNIGIVGTAAGGTVDKVEILGSFADATDKFGPYDAFDSGATPPSLTLVRALQVAYNNGASTVLAVRVAKGTPTSAKITLASATGTAAELTAQAPGTFGNPAKAKVEAASDPLKAKVTLTFKSLSEVDEAVTGADLLSQINAGSAIATAVAGTKPAEKPSDLAEKDFTAGDNGADATVADYKRGHALLNEDAHIIVAAGQDEDMCRIEGTCRCRLH